MPRSSKTASADSSDTAELLDRVCKALEALADQVKVMRTILDEIQDDLAWALDNGRLVARHREPAPPMHITSMAKDPLSPDWAKLLNSTRPQDLPPEALHPAAHTERTQQDLF
jgi:hypothetical protein